MKFANKRTKYILALIPDKQRQSKLLDDSFVKDVGKPALSSSQAVRVLKWENVKWNIDTYKVNRGNYPRDLPSREMVDWLFKIDWFRGSSALASQNITGRF